MRRDLAGDALTVNTRPAGAKAQCTLAAARNLARLDNSFTAAALANWCDQPHGESGGITVPRWPEIFNRFGLVRQGECCLRCFSAAWVETPELLLDVRLAAWGFVNGGEGHVVALRRNGEGTGFLEYDNENRDERPTPLALTPTLPELHGRVRSRPMSTLVAVVACGSPLDALVRQRRRQQREQQRAVSV